MHQPPKSTLFPYTTLFRSRRTHRRHRFVGIPHVSKQVHLRSEEHTSELQSRGHLVCRLLLEKKNKTETDQITKVIAATEIALVQHVVIIARLLTGKAEFAA